MKKILALLVCIAFLSFAKAQSFEIGGRYMAMSNWFFNSNVTNSGGTQGSATEDYAASYSYSYGLHLAYNFTDHTGLEVNLMMASLTQSYTGNFASSPGFVYNDYSTVGFPYYPSGDYKATSTINAIQIPVMFRFLSGNGAYVEAGPQIELVSNANYAATYKEGPISSYNENTKPYYTSNYFSGVLAFGNNIRLAKSFFFNINLRLIYDFTDLKGVDAMGENMKDSRLYSGATPMYSSYAPTNAVSASFGVGFVYRFGHDF